MSTITRQAGGASAYSRYHYPIFQAFDDHGLFGSDDPDAAGQDWSAAIDELLRIRQLEDDWDGEGTVAPDPALVDWAIALAKGLEFRGVSPPDRVHACINPTVNFEWYTPLGYTEIEIVSPVEAECRSVRKGANTTEVVRLYRQL